MTSLYDVHTVLEIPYHPISVTDAISPSNIAASHSTQQDLAVAANKDLTIITNNSTDVETINFDCSIDAIVWSKNGEYLVAAGADGKLAILRKDDFKVIFSENILTDYVNGAHCSSDRVFIALSITEMAKKGIYCIGAALVSGKVIVLEHLDLSQCFKDFKINKTNIKQSFIDPTTHHTSLKGLLCIRMGQKINFLTVGHGGDFMVQWCKQEPFFSKDDEKGYRDVDFVDHEVIRGLPNNLHCDGFEKCTVAGTMLFALDNLGHLYQLSWPNLLLMKWWKDLSFSDFLIQVPHSTTMSNRASSSKLFGILNDVSNSSSHFAVLKIPTMEEVYKVSCSRNCVLPSACRNTEYVHYIEVSSTGDASESQLILKSVTETLPTNRLLFLLQQCCFDKAFSFAATYNLDKQIIYQSKASYLLHSMTSMERKQLNETFPELTTCINQIADAVYIGELCVSVALPDLHLTFELLSLARNRLDEGGRAFRASDSGVELDVKVEVDRLLDRLITYRMAFENGDSSAWKKFSQASLQHEVAAQLLAGNLYQATVICSRHQYELVESLKAGKGEKLKTMLNFIAEDVDTDALINLLKHLMPVILPSNIPDCIQTMVSWIHDRALVLEEVSTDSWPNNALQLAKLYFEVQEKLSVSGFLSKKLCYTQQVHKSQREGIAKLRLLVSRLQLLQRLQNTYNCKVSLKEFTKENTLTLTFRLLDKVVAPELIPSCLQDTVRPYMAEHQLPEDATLLQYIKDILKNCHERSWGAFQTLSERKTIAIIKCLKQGKIRIEAVVALAQTSSSPWSPDVNTLVQDSLKQCEEEGSSTNETPDKQMYANWAEDLKHSICLERLPVLASKYGVNIISNRDSVSQKMFVRRLVKDGSSGAIKDAIYIAQAFTDKPQEHVYRLAIISLLMLGKFQECLDILDQHSSIAVTLLKHAVCHTLLMLEESHDMFKTERANCSTCAITMLEHVLSDKKYLHQLRPDLRREWVDELILIKNIHRLQVKYGELLTVKRYREEACRNKILAQNLRKLNQDEAGNRSAVVLSNVTDLSMGGNTHTTNKNESVANKSSESHHDNGEGDLKARDSNSSFARMLDLAHLLGVPQHAIESHVIIEAAKSQQPQAAVKLAKELFGYSLCTQTSETLLLVVQILLNDLKSNPEKYAPLLPDIQELVNCAATCCGKHRLLEVMSQIGLCNLGVDLQAMTDTNAKSCLAKCTTTAPKLRISKYEHLEWLHGWYREQDGLTLRGNEAMNLFARFIDSVMTHDGFPLAIAQPTDIHSIKSKLSVLYDVLMRMTNLLKNSHHDVLALQWMVKTMQITVLYICNHRAFFYENSSERTALTQLIMYTVKKGIDENVQYTEMVAEKILLAPVSDVELAVGFLLNLSDSKSVDVLNNVCQSLQNNYKKIMAVAKAGLYISNCHGILAQVPKYRMLQLDAKWAQTLDNLNIPVDGILLASQQWKQKFLLKLTSHPLITGALLKSYCKDYNLDTDKALLQYVDVLLGGDTHISRDLSSMSSPDSLSVQYNFYASSMAVVSSNQSSPFLSYASSKAPKCPAQKTWKIIEEELKWVTGNVVDKYELLRQLERCFRSNISPYDYDRIYFLLNLIKSTFSSVEQVLNVDKGLSLLFYLRHVTREQPPSDQEKMQFSNRGATSHKSLPILANTRLPVHALLYGDANHSWKVLSAEVTEKSADLLAPVAKLLKLNVDKLYMTAADNMIAKFRASCVDSLKSQLPKIQALVSKIESFQMSVAMAKRVSEILPSCVEKVESYKWCISLLNDWKTSISENSAELANIESAFQAIVRDYHITNTEHLLTEAKLNSPDYMMLADQPSKLIIHLYQHPSIIERFYVPGDSYPDIHGVVDELAKMYNQDVAKPRLTMILKLLLSVDKQANQNQDDDSTVNLERIRSASMTTFNENKEEKTLIHLLYLLNCGNPIQQAKHLIKLISDHKNRRITSLTRARAVNCLFLIVDDDIIFNLTEKRADELRDDLQILAYLAKLQAANFKISVAQLRQADKLSVVQSILSSASHRHNPDALKVAAEMCQEYGPASSDTWAVVLQQLMAMQEVTYLHQLLPNIYHIPAVSTLLCLASVWQSCVTLPLVALTPPLDEQQTAFVTSCYHFLVVSPVLHRMNLAYVAEHFESLQLYALALGCLLASPGNNDRAKKLASTRYDEINSQLEILCKDKSPLIGLVLISSFMKTFKDNTNV